MADPQTVEHNKKLRVEKNIAQKRQEKGLVTISESINETDPSKILFTKDSKFNQSKLIQTTTRLDSTKPILEAEIQDEAEFCNHL